MPKNVSSEPVKCIDCDNSFIRNSNRQSRCEDCGLIHNEKRKVTYMKGYHQENYEKKGYSQSGENNNNWAGGIGTYRKIKAHIDKCERCPSTKNLLTHHKDRNRYNNAPENLERLCKKCHQKEHRLDRDASGKFISSHKV